MTPEGAIRNQICSYLYMRRCFSFLHDSVGIYDPKIGRFRRNTSPYRMKGVADILGIWKGRFLAIEVKAGKNTASDEQMEFLKRVQAEGGIAILAWSLEDVREVLEPKTVEEIKL